MLTVKLLTYETHKINAVLSFRRNRLMVRFVLFCFPAPHIMYLAHYLLSAVMAHGMSYEAGDRNVGWLEVGGLHL